MKHIVYVFALICLFGSVNVNAQVASYTSIALTIGKWVVADQKKVYQIRVEGRGNTFEQARSNGFSLAIEQAVGALVLTETEMKNTHLVRNDLISYSSGYVENFKIIDQTPTSVIMDVWVSESKLADRILNKEKETTQFSGELLHAQASTYLNSRQQLSKVVDAVLNDYPRSAFAVQQLGSEFVVDNNNTPHVKVKYKLEWNYNYLLALDEMLSLVSDKKSWTKKQNKIVLSMKKPGNWMGKTTEYVVDTNSIYDQIYDGLEKKPLYIFGVLRSASGYIVKCRMSTFSMTSGGSYLSIYESDDFQAVMDFDFNQNELYKVRNIHAVDLGVTSDAEYCDRR